MLCTAYLWTACLNDNKGDNKMLTSNSMQTIIGRAALLYIEKGQLGVRVEVLDVRETYGRTDCLVKPVAGCGQKWVSCERLSFKGEMVQSRIAG